MPLLNVQIMQGHSLEAKTRLLQNCSQAVVDSIAAPLASVSAVIHETMPGHVIVAGEIGKEMPLVQVRLLEGRSDEKKAALIAALNQAVSKSLDVSPQSIRVIIGDIATTDFGVAGGITALAAGR